MEGGAKRSSEPEHGRLGMVGRGHQQPPTPPRPPARSLLSPDASFSALGCSQRCGHPKGGAGGFSPRGRLGWLGAGRGLGWFGVMGVHPRAGIPLLFPSQRSAY